ncbi:LysR substrate-binding domain-containing protein [Oceanicella actignis]|uniref:LysR substrate-binding domain-containing protein n=1 Tax=Oceanicella actignis TaxID=1189325 RepID=UPI0011E81CA5|nr:LysR substrate-binding domain-containing protein [Oceanicella actignis]TYO83954.1 LysR family glycine cleavage system transcriptional activator [Oceanicella actignis]
MGRTIRNLKSFQVFEAAYAARNVTRAARALNITQSAVSYHIKKLEDEIGAPLFRRTPSGLEPTEAGDELARHVARGLEIIRTGIERLTERPRTVRVALLPMFASRWFSSRIGALLEARPDLNLSIQNHNNSFARMVAPESFADIGFQWGRGAWKGFHVRRLWPERLAVVCSPDYLARHPISRPEDLAACTLLHVDDTRMWDEWFAGRGLRLSPDQPQMMLEDRHFQLSSTINGLGVSLFAAWLVAPEIRSGALVNPFGRSFETSFAYHVIMPRSVAPSEATRAFRDWLDAQCREAPAEA